MKVNEKQDLIPEEIKEKYARKYLTGFIILVCSVLVISIAVPYVSMSIISNQISKIENENNEYNLQKKEIDILQSEIDEYMTVIRTYEESTFPFTLFMYDLEIMRPVSVHIISVDTPDRLINEGAAEEKETVSKEKDKSKEEKENQEEESAEAVIPAIKYEKDLAGQVITIRGYGGSQNDISNYLHSISSLPYIARLDVVAIEEHKIEGGVYNIFEITVVGVGYNENQIQG